MKFMKKPASVFLVALLGILLSFTKIDPKSALDSRLNEHKRDCKELIKPALYEGSRTTYFTLRKKQQFKTVELFLQFDHEYIFGISGKECTTPVTLRFYDSGDQKSRTLISEHKGIDGKNHVFSSKDLNAAYCKKMPHAERLKSIFVEYEVASGNDLILEGIVLVIGNR